MNEKRNNVFITLRSLHVHLLVEKSPLAIRYACMSTYGTLYLSTIARNLVSYLVFIAETAGSATIIGISVTSRE